MIEPKILYYGFGGGLGHITRFRAFSYTMGIKPILMTSVDAAIEMTDVVANKVLLFPKELATDKDALRCWVIRQLQDEKPDKLIIDAFPGGILGELCDMPELEGIEVEYIARILKIDAYERRLDGRLPHISTIWQVERFHGKQNLWLESLAAANGAVVKWLNLKYPPSDADSKIILPPDCWLIVHSGSDYELQQLWEYANDTAVLESAEPAFVVVGQCPRPDFLPQNIPYYSVYPVTTLLERASKVISAAGFNIMQQMKNMKEKHLILPFDRALDEQADRFVSTTIDSDNSI